jgi:hypothetical protein
MIPILSVVWAATIVQSASVPYQPTTSVFYTYSGSMTSNRWMFTRTGSPFRWILVDGVFVAARF